MLARITLDAPNEIDDALFWQGAILAREGAPSPIPGAVWWGAPTMLEANARGEVGFLWSVEGGGVKTPVLVRNQAVFVAEGDVLTATAPFGIDRINWAQLNDRGDVVWQGSWDPFTSISWAGEAVFLGTKPLVQLDVTSVDGKVLTDLTGATPSDGGRYALFGAETTFQVDALYRVDLGPWSELELGALAGAAPAPDLVGIGSLEPGAATTLRVEGGTPGTDAAIVIGLSQLDLPLFGTTLVPFPTAVLTGLPIDADGAAELNLSWPSALAPGSTIYAQAFVPDAGTPFGFASSNAIAAVTP